MLGDGALGAERDVPRHLRTPVGLTIGRATGTVTIVDDDARRPSRWRRPTPSGAEQSRDPISFTVTRSANLAGAIVVNLAWSGTARYGTDYTVTVTGGTLSAERPAAHARRRRRHARRSR